MTATPERPPVDQQAPAARLVTGVLDIDVSIPDNATFLRHVRPTLPTG